MRKSVILATIGILLVSTFLWAAGGRQSVPASASGEISGTVTFWQDINDMAADIPTVWWWRDNYRLFQEKYPNVRLEVTNTPGGGINYLTKITTELAAGNAPDVFKTWLTGRLQPFVDAGRVQALNGFLDARPELKRSINPEALKLATFGDKFYAIPNQKSGELLYYNKKMFADHGIQIPKTYDEFLSICARFNAAGIVPIGMGGAQIWPVSMPYMVLFGRMHGPTLYEEVILGQKAKFDDPAFAETGAKLQEMIRANVFNTNVNATDMEECRAGFSTGRYPMLFDGVWNLGRYIQALGEDVGFFDFPPIPGGRGNVNDQLVNWDEGYAISVGARNQAAAEAFIEFIYSKERQTELANYGFLITTFNPPTNTDLPRVMVEVSNTIDNSTYNYIPWDNPLGAGMGNNFNQAVQRLYVMEDPVRVFQDLNRLARFEWE